MPKYRSKPVEIEAMRWVPDAPRNATDGERTADRIVAWVNANGGKAWFSRHGGNPAVAAVPSIAVHTLNGTAYAAPGHYVVKGPNDFYPCDADTFRSRWELLADAPERHRSAVTGEFVSEEFAEEHPDTTVSESGR